MSRRLLKLLTTVSLLPCIAVCMLWVRSYFVSDLWLAQRSSWGGFVETGDGELRFELLSAVDRPWSTSGFVHRTDKVDGSGVFPDRIPGERVHFRWRSFALVTGVRWGDDHHALFLPAWFLATLLVIPAVARAMTRMNPHRAGGCASCGYDLTGNVSGVCPECGVAGMRE